MGGFTVGSRPELEITATWRLDEIEHVRAVCRKNYCFVVDIRIKNQGSFSSPRIRILYYTRIIFMMKYVQWHLLTIARCTTGTLNNKDD